MPMRGPEAEALIKYVGKKVDAPEGDRDDKFTETECHQWSTPTFIKQVVK